jgi:hypothetical protein
VLPRIATGRDDAYETLHAGKSIEDLERSQLPPCVDEHGTIMAPFPLSMQKKHPYSGSGATTHGHFTDTPYTIRPYSAAGIPFRWMLREQSVTDNTTGDAPMLPCLLDQIGAYDIKGCHEAIAPHGAQAIIPTRKNGKPWKERRSGAEARNTIQHVKRRIGCRIWKNGPATIGAVWWKPNCAASSC